jgi:hypothetical protein
MFTNMNGCDSTLTLYLTITKSSAGSITAAACNSYTLNGITYSATGLYTQTLTNVEGCDSNLSLNLKINNSSNSAINVIACNSYTYNNQTYTATGNSTHKFISYAGCDSNVTLILKINKVSSTVTQNGSILTADEVGAVYQWLDCNNGNTPIVGANGKSYTAKANGRYAVNVTLNNCTVTSTCLTVTTSGIYSQNISDVMRVYPNPSNGEVNVSFTNTLNNTSVRLINVVGQVVFEQFNITGDHFTFNVATQPYGIYFVEVNNNGNISRVKIIKN